MFGRKHCQLCNKTVKSLLCNGCKKQVARYMRCLIDGDELTQPGTPQQRGLARKLYQVGYEELRQEFAQ